MTDTKALVFVVDDDASLRAACGFPIVLGGDVLGVIEVGSIPPVTDIARLPSARGAVNVDPGNRIDVIQLG